MTDSSDAPRRLIYGPADFRGYDGVVIDAETGARWAAATGARCGARAAGSWRRRWRASVFCAISDRESGRRT